MKKLNLAGIKITSFPIDMRHLRGGKEADYTDVGYPGCGPTGLLVDPDCQH
ncbi:hypothetical protein AB9P05_03820 [Roseivirga sp. BDSF3-8]|uniref:hypothetical protein n=1 Tax=Roseivirga sp. BDSF3-8 TaxID=3241598 RepID=UPI00353256B8